MNRTSAGYARIASIWAVGFLAGLAAANFPTAIASADGPAADLTKKTFLVFIDEVKQNFVFGDKFVGSYSRTFTLSDGSTRTIELTPVVYKGVQLIELRDNGFRSYMALDGRNTSDGLLVETVDDAEWHGQLKKQGWPSK